MTRAAPPPAPNSRPRFNGITRPAPGNHEYGTAGAAGYFGYFGPVAGSPSTGWYSFDIGSWHVIALNSNCTIVGCAAGSPQEEWPRATWRPAQQRRFGESELQAGPVEEILAGL